MNLKKKKKGFTLIELMAVIAIIAILAAVLVPTVSGYITRSKKTAVITQIRNVVNAVETYNATAAVTIDTTATYNSATGSGDSAKPASISDSTKTVSELVEIVGDDLLNDDNINKLGNLKIGTAVLINQDENAVNNIELYSNGNLEKYKKLTVNNEVPEKNNNQ